MRSYKERLKLAYAIRAEIPWASVVAGAPHFNFIRIDRGETIAGSHTPKNKGTFGYQGSAWSRAVAGSRYIEWRGNADYMDICEYVECPPSHAEAWRILKSVTAPPKSGKGWMEAALRVLTDLAEEWLRPVEPEAIESQLRDGERFEIRIHPLAAMAETVEANP